MSAKKRWVMRPFVEYLSDEWHELTRRGWLTYRVLRWRDTGLPGDGPRQCQMCREVVAYNAQPNPR